MTDSDTKALPGELVHERYRVLRLIGRGGMGAVYEAVDERLGVRVALKESFGQPSYLREQFAREARLLAMLKHRALPKVSDYFIENYHAFLVMEYIEGASLAELLKKQAPLPVQQVIAWADQVLDVLIYLHEHDRRIIHRDIKPHNLRVTSAGVISLLDFGLAKATANHSACDEARSVYGYTRWYAPIEQIRDSGTNVRSDIYALGATLYHLLTGVRPADAEVRAEAILTSGADCLRRADAIAAVSAELASIIDRAMAPSDRERYQTAQEFRQALSRLGRTARADDRHAVKPSGLTLPRPMRRASRFALAAAVLIAGVGLGTQIVQHLTPGDLGTPSTGFVERPNTSRTESKDKQPTATLRSKPVIEKPTSQAFRDLRRDHANRSDPSVATKSKEQKAPENLPALPRRQRSLSMIARMPEPERAPNQKPKSTVVRDIESPRLLRAPDGIEVMRFKDGRIHVVSERDRGGMR